MELSEIVSGMTPVEFLAMLVSLLVCLSVAAERLVAIIKGIIPFLNVQNDDEKKEGWRRAILQALAVISGVITAMLAWPALKDIFPTSWNSLPVILALGFLASGGSGFWNGILAYVKYVKDIRQEIAKEKKLKKSG